MVGAPELEFDSLAVIAEACGGLGRVHTCSWASRGPLLVDLGDAMAHWTNDR